MPPPCRPAPAMLGTCGHEMGGKDQGGSDLSPTNEEPGGHQPAALANSPKTPEQGDRQATHRLLHNSSASGSGGAKPRASPHPLQRAAPGEMGRGPQAPPRAADPGRGLRGAAALWDALPSRAAAGHECTPLPSPSLRAQPSAACTWRGPCGPLAPMVSGPGPCIPPGMGPRGLGPGPRGSRPRGSSTLASMALASSTRGSSTRGSRPRASRARASITRGSSPRGSLPTAGEREGKLLRGVGSEGASPLPPFPGRCRAGGGGDMPGGCPLPRGLSLLAPGQPFPGPKPLPTPRAGPLVRRRSATRCCMPPLSPRASIRGPRGSPISGRGSPMGPPLSSWGGPRLSWPGMWCIGAPWWGGPR